jgi:hypothetical protein
MKTRGPMRAVDFVLMAIAAGSCVLLIQPSLLAFPNVGDCTDECQNKFYFYTPNGSAPHYYHLNCADCLLCVQGQCAWTEDQGPSCNLLPNVGNRYQRCENGTLVCQISGNFIWAEAKDLTGCGAWLDTSTDVCGPVPVLVGGP